MKNILLLTFLITFSFSTAKAQVFTEGEISYSVSVESDQPEVASMFEGSNMKVYFKDNLTRTDFKMGAFMNSSNISDAASNRSLLLMDSMMGKWAVETTGEETDKLNAQSNFNYEIEEITDETKEILGLKCKKAIVKSNQIEGLIVVWYSPEIKFEQTSSQQMNFNLNGAALEFTAVTQGITYDI